MMTEGTGLREIRRAGGPRGGVLRRRVVSCQPELDVSSRSDWIELANAPLDGSERDDGIARVRSQEGCFSCDTAASVGRSYWQSLDALCMSVLGGREGRLLCRRAVRRGAQWRMVAVGRTSAARQALERRRSRECGRRLLARKPLRLHRRRSIRRRQRWAIVACSESSTGRLTVRVEKVDEVARGAFLAGGCALCSEAFDRSGRGRSLSWRGRHCQRREVERKHLRWRRTCTRRRRSSRVCSLAPRA